MNRSRVLRGASKVRARIKTILRSRAPRTIDGLERELRREKRRNLRLRNRNIVLVEEAKSPVERQSTGTQPLSHDRGRPSYVLAARLHRRANRNRVYRDQGFREPILQLYPKTAGRAFAQAHGVQVPEVFGRWRSLEEIPWSELPERFVLKSSVGGGGLNVFPLSRTGEEFIDHLTGETVTDEQVTEHLRSRIRSSAVFFAEELLAAAGGDELRLPPDVKVFCFYGEVAYIEVRTADWSRARDLKPQARSFLPDGSDVTGIRPLMTSGSSRLKLSRVDDIVDASSRLSRGIRRPLERIDFYITERGIIFGEITQNPGHIPALLPEWDERLGRAYEQAYARLLDDICVDAGLTISRHP